MKKEKKTIRFGTHFTQTRTQIFTKKFNGRVECVTQ